MFIAIPLVLMGMLFASTSLAHDDEHARGGQGMHEEGSVGSAIEMDRKSRAMAHEYKEEHSGDHSKEHYENKKMKEEGSSMREEAMKMKEMEQKPMDEGNKM